MKSSARLWQATTYKLKHSGKKNLETDLNRKTQKKSFQQPQEQNS